MTKDQIINMMEIAAANGDLPFYKRLEIKLKALNG